MRDIHKGGRPKKVRPEGFWALLLQEYETMTIAQMAACHSVSRSTINTWLRQARQEAQDVKAQ